MLRSIRAAAFIAIAFCASFALYAWVVRPYRCNISSKRTARRLDVAVSLPSGSLRIASMARLNIEELEPCVSAIPSNIAADMVLAGSYRTIGDRQKALDVYGSALRYDRRPEIYFDLGEVQLELGDRKSGMQNLITACLYDHAYLDEIAKEQPEVTAAIRAYLVQHIKPSK
jgi:tetratricopeptide (TPR) repeat protein